MVPAVYLVAALGRRLRRARPDRGARGRPRPRVGGGGPAHGLVLLRLPGLDQPIGRDDRAGGRRRHRPGQRPAADRGHRPLPPRGSRRELCGHGSELHRRIAHLLRQRGLGSPRGQCRRAPVRPGPVDRHRGPPRQPQRSARGHDDRDGGAGARAARRPVLRPFPGPGAGVRTPAAVPRHRRGHRRAQPQRGPGPDRAVPHIRHCHAGTDPRPPNRVTAGVLRCPARRRRGRRPSARAGMELDRAVLHRLRGLVANDAEGGRVHPARGAGARRLRLYRRPDRVADRHRGAGPPAPGPRHRTRGHALARRLARRDDQRRADRHARRNRARRPARRRRGSRAVPAVAHRSGSRRLPRPGVRGRLDRPRLRRPGPRRRPRRHCRRWLRAERPSPPPGRRRATRATLRRGRCPGSLRPAGQLRHRGALRARCRPQP